MFGRRRHRAPVITAPPAPVPVPGVELSEEQLFERIRERLDRHMGAQGDWTLVRRTTADTDTFFHEMAAFSLAREVTAAIVGTTVPLSAGQTAEAAEAPAVPAPVITVQTVPTGGSGVADLDPALFGGFSTAASDTERPDRGQSVLEHVMFELNTVAVWADPQRHDPSSVNPELVAPSGTSTATPKKRWNGTRVS